MDPDSNRLAREPLLGCRFSAHISNVENASVSIASAAELEGLSSAHLSHASAVSDPSAYRLQSEKTPFDNRTGRRTDWTVIDAVCLHRVSKSEQAL